MGMILRDSFARGWTPSVDAVHAPADALLRADNLVLDQRGVLALRAGSAKINGSALSELDVHSLFTASLGGTRYRMAGAGAVVFANSTSIATGTAGSGDIAFGSALGQILWARSTTKKKYDGTTVRNWGIAAPNAAPTAAARTPDSETFASFNSAESPAFTVNEDDGTGATFTAGYEGTANGAFILNPDDATSRAYATKTFVGATNFSTYDAGQTGTDDDLISLWIYVTEPQFFDYVLVAIDINDGTYELDYYQAEFRSGTQTPHDDGSDPSVVNITPQVGWNHVSLRRGSWKRLGQGTAGQTWATVRAVRVMAFATSGQYGSTAQVRFDQMQITGGAQYPLTGDYQWLIVAVRNDGSYTAKSPPSAASAILNLTARGAAITLAGAAVNALDTQVNELWLFRRGGALDTWYRTAVKDDDPFSGDEVINDEMSDADALIANITLEAYNIVPPDSIVGIAGPHYDRTMALTATFLYPSQPRNPDSFDSRHPVRVGDNSETAYWVVKSREELYVGTSKDIYRFEGDWTLLPDGETLNVTKRPLSLAHPPISSAVALDGDTLIYLAADGWRQLGADQPFTNGDVDLLYRGETRHGVSPVNLATGRFKAALTKGRFTALTPEGASTTSSTVLHRYVPDLKAWYRHTYGRSWRCVYREPDGTLIASDNAGFVWTLDTGTQDDGSNIAVVLWTPVDADGRRHQRKDPQAARIRLDTAGATATVAVHLDGSSSAATSLSASSSGLGVSTHSVTALDPFMQFQFRVTGSFSTFKWYDHQIEVVDLPPLQYGRVPDSNAGTPRPKVVTGLRIRMCTLSASRTITPIVDGTSLTTGSFTTDLAQPDECVLSFAAPQTVTDVAFSVDGLIELYDWAPLVDHVLPLGRTLWDSGPIELGSRVVWVTHLELKAKLTGDLTITPYIDDQPLTAATVTAPAGDPITTHTVALSRPVRGRQARFRVSSTSAFHLYWIEPKYRLTGADSDLRKVRVEVAA